MRPAGTTYYQIGIDVEPKAWAFRLAEIAAPLRALPINQRGEVSLGLLPREFVLQRRTSRKDLQSLGWVIDDIDDSHVHNRYLGVTCRRL
jgi:hypothetical protein